MNGLADGDPSAGAGEQRTAQAPTAERIDVARFLQQTLDYNYEVVSYILEYEKVSFDWATATLVPNELQKFYNQPETDFLRNMQGERVGAGHREKLVRWMMEVSGGVPVTVQMCHLY